MSRLLLLNVVYYAVSPLVYINENDCNETTDFLN